MLAYDPPPPRPWETPGDKNTRRGVGPGLVLAGSAVTPRASRIRLDIKVRVNIPLDSEGAHVHSPKHVREPGLLSTVSGLPQRLQITASSHGHAREHVNSMLIASTGNAHREPKRASRKST